MSFRIELHPKVVEELQDDYQWYELRSEGLGKRFIASVHKRMQELEQSPENYGKRKGNFRAAAIDAFPFIIVFEIFESTKTVFVSYIFHTRRNPRIKYKR